MKTIDRFAEALSQHGDIKRAAAETGQSESYGYALFQRLRKRLGPQAV